MGFIQLKVDSQKVYTKMMYITRFGSMELAAESKPESKPALAAEIKPESKPSLATESKPAIQTKAATESVHTRLPLVHECDMSK